MPRSLPEWIGIGVDLGSVNDEPQHVTCALPPESREWRPDPFPGSEKAFLAGCTCPQCQPWPGALIFSTDCPVHELEREKN